MAQKRRSGASSSSENTAPPVGRVEPSVASEGVASLPPAPPAPPAPDDELTISDIILALQANWRRIALGVLAVALLVSAYMLLKSNIYESTATLIIRTPEIKMTGEASPLSVEMLRKLAESIDVKLQVYNTLAREDNDMELAPFQNFQRQMRSSVEEGAGRRTNQPPEPIVYLTASSIRPQWASAVANTWADVVTSRSVELYGRGVSELDTFLSRVYQDAESRLIESETALTSKTLEAQEDVKQARFSARRQKSIDLEDEVFELEVEIRTNVALMEELERLLGESELNDMWLGQAVTIAYLMQTDGLEAEVGGSDLILATDTSGTLRVSDLPETQRKVANLVIQSLNQQQDLRRYTASSGLNLKRLQKSNLTTRVMDLAKRREGIEYEMRDVKSQIDSLQVFIAEHEIDGYWLGELLSRRALQKLTSPTATLPPLEMDINPQTAVLADLVDRIVAQEVDLARFEEANQLLLKKARLEILIEEQSENIAAINLARKSQIMAETQYAAIREELKEIPEKIDLDKAITDDALWNMFIQGMDSRRAGSPLRTEVINSVYQDLRLKMLNLFADMQLQEEQVRYLTERNEEVRTEIDELRQDVVMLELDQTNRTDTLARNKLLLKALAEQYETWKSQVQTLTLDYRRLEKEKMFLDFEETANQEAMDTVTEEVEDIANQVQARYDLIATTSQTLNVHLSQYRANRLQLDQIELEQIRKENRYKVLSDMLLDYLSESEKLEMELALDRQALTLMEREVTKFESLAEELRARAQEVAILASQQAARSGTTVLHRAEDNPLKVGPARSKYVLMAMAMAFMALWAWFVLREKVLFQK